MFAKYREKRYFSATFTILLMIITTLLSFGMFKITQSNASNIGLLYILALILVSRYTDGYRYGFVFTVFSVIFINYFFTYPFFKLNFILKGYPVTFILTYAISFITSAATSHLKIQAALLAEREEIINKAEKEKMRANLLRAISHDLRTPLTSIIGTSDSYLELGESISSEEKNNLVLQINDDANWLLNMVENLLSVTRIQDSEETTTKVTKSPEIVEEVISEALQRFKKRHPETKIQVTMPDDFIMIPMDPLLIEQVILNLLDNASVHSDSHDPIQLNIIDSPSSVVFCIRDHGKGIDPELLPNIFDGNSSRHKKTDADSHRGMGIGLSICKTIVSAHSGTITVLNHDKGAEFIFSLPKEETTLE